MVAFGHDMRDVELVEGDDAPSAARPVSAPTPDDGDTPRRDQRPARRGPRRWAVGLVVALLGVGGGEVASAARARSSMAALAVVPGVLAPLDGPVRELWRADRTVRAELTEVAGLLVGVAGRVGSADVVALDPATGATVWRTPVRPGGPGDGGGGTRCVVPREPSGEPAPGAGAAAGGRAGSGTTAPVVVCVVDRSPRARPGTAPSPADPAAPGLSTDRVLVLDAATGTVLSRRSVERSTTLATLDGDVVAAHVDADGVVHVTRTDPRGLDERWTFVSPRPLPVPHPGWSTRMVVDDGLVLVDEADGWVLTGEGEVRHAWAGSPADELQGSARILAGQLLVRPDSNGGPWPRTEVTDLATGHRLTVDGRALAAWPDDGSLDSSLLVRAGGPDGLLAYDVGTGTVRWSAEGHVEGRALVLGGRVVRVTSGALTAVDGRTGETVWRSPLVRPARTSLVTDGRLVVVTELDPDHGVVVGAYGLDDGRLRWRSDVADDVAVLAVVGRQLFAWTGEQLVALTAPE